MLTDKRIDELIGVTESFHASYKLHDILQNKESREKLFEEFLKEESDFSFDWFTEYFQTEHSDRKGKKQDFTPDGIIRVASGVLGETTSNVDLCAGTGGLTIKRYSENPNASFYCEEFSDRAMPFLIFNLAIRNINATICHGDSLTRDFKYIYQLTKSEKFSDIQVVEALPKVSGQTVIMNPPYSLPWTADKEFLKQERFASYATLAPKSKADFAFLLQGLDLMDSNGTMSIILPHGVLFRGASEGEIRQKLIEQNYLDAVVGLPAKAFLNTDIQTVLLILKKNRPTQDILFVDASNEYKKEKSQNVLENENVNKILDTVRNRKTIDKFSRMIPLSELQENEYNLNIPRYIDTFEEEEPISLTQIMSDMAENDAQIKKAEQELAIMMQDLVGTTPEADREIKMFAEFFGNRVGVKPRKQAQETGGEQLSLL